MAKGASRGWPGASSIPATCPERLCDGGRTVKAEFGRALTMSQVPAPLSTKRAAHSAQILSWDLRGSDFPQAHCWQSLTIKSDHQLRHKKEEKLAILNTYAFTIDQVPHVFGEYCFVGHKYKYMGEYTIRRFPTKHKAAMHKWNKREGPST